jgi:hypothetical protein
VSCHCSPSSELHTSRKLESPSSHISQESGYQYMFEICHFSPDSVPHVSCESGKDPSPCFLWPDGCRTVRLQYCPPIAISEALPSHTPLLTAYPHNCDDLPVSYAENISFGAHFGERWMVENVLQRVRLCRPQTHADV